MHKRTRGILLLVLGGLLLLGAAALFLLQQQRDRLAGQTAAALVSAVKSGRYTVQTEPAQPTEAEENERPAGDTPVEPVAVTPDGHAVLGILRIEALSIELPVLAQWSYTLLDVSPCRYSGSTATDDLVICAHNYSRHFGKLSALTAGDSVSFADMNGHVWQYQVAEVAELPPDAVEEMTAGNFDLTLFTCTYGGASRVTVRCQRAD